MPTEEVALDSAIVGISGHDAVEPVAGGAVLTGTHVTVRYPGRCDRFYRHGWQSWSQTRWVELDEPVSRVPIADLRVLDDDPAWVGSSNQGGAVVGARDGDRGVLLIGALGLDGRVETTADGMSATSRTSNRWFVSCGAEEQVFADYARHLGDVLGRRQLPAQRVWCSWYSFYTGITEMSLSKVIDNVRDLSFDVIQVDDGWQQHIGDWEANGDFPSGMAAMADRIHDAGFGSGLWLAPFLGHERSQLFGRHPEWFVRDDTGALISAGWNWGGRVHALDVTNPAALDHVLAAVRAAVEWGFRYLKLDFVYAAALPGVRHDDVDRHVAYRQAIETLRAAVGDDVVLLACGAPVIPSIGVFDAIRIGPDVAEVWEVDKITNYLHHLAAPAARYAVATSVHRLWLRELIATDPDVAYFRTRYCLLTDEQKAHVQDLTRVCRFRATSDDPTTLDPHEHAALAAYLDEQVDVRPVGRYRYAIDDRIVDFGPVASQPPLFMPLEG